MIGDFAHQATCDFSQLSPDELAQVVLIGEVLRRFLEARQREAVAEFERQGAWQDDGATSAGNWLAARARRRRAVVRREVRLATAVAAAPAVAVVASQLSGEHLQLLASCRSERTLQAYEPNEQQLIDAALSLSVEEFARVVRGVEDAGRSRRVGDGPPSRRRCRPGASVPRARRLVGPVRPPPARRR